MSRRSRGSRSAEAGSVLMLVPAGVLVLMVLGSIAVDSAIAFLAQRELAATARAVANDAATEALSQPAFYAGGGAPRVVLDEAAARQVVERAMAHRLPRGVQDVVAQVRVVDRQVCITFTGRVEYIFAKAVPGVDHGTTVTGRAAATATEGPAGATVSPSTPC